MNDDPSSVARVHAGVRRTPSKPVTRKAAFNRAIGTHKSGHNPLFDLASLREINVRAKPEIGYLLCLSVRS